MEADTDENDGFDWEAAAADIEKISLAEDRQRNQGNGNVLKEKKNWSCKSSKSSVGVLSGAHTKLQQKTLLGYVQKSSNQQPSFMDKPKQQPIDSAIPCAADMATTDGPCADLAAAKTWVYPVNVPMRDYQYSIVQTALFSNTLVSLPTGLGKTLIAAVVMYNFFRWFPTGKIVFTAPSRPLVLQQIEACHESVGIPQEWTIDMTGQMNPGHRSAVWQAKRVFFVTPQVFEKDIQSGICPMQDLVCLVVDEAHRALGNYSYCVAVRKLMEASIKLRILALTATPGSKQVTIQSVVDNLQISCLEYRNENDADVKQYVHNRKLELLQVAMDSECLKIRDLLLEVLQPLVNRLCGFGVFYSKDAARLVPFEFLTARDKFRQAPPPGLDPRQFGEVEACFGATITLYHIFKLLFSHGIRPAFEMLKEKLQSGPFGRLMGRNEKLHEIKVLMQKQVGNGASSPKLTKLQQLMAEHFEGNDPTKTRVIIFTNFRESVKDILEALQALGDVVKAMDFIGQSSGRSSKGQSQKVQQLVLQKFRNGGYNTIVATSIAEEGLDIMEVDLVISFDANISPLRMIQRMGRTGRKRDGRVIVLASEGAEVQGYLKKQAKSNALGKHMHNGGVHCFNFHNSPRMIPHCIRPAAELVELSIVKFVPRIKSKQKPVQGLDIGNTDLTTEEALVLRRYIEPYQPTTALWIPSLIAFPQCQLLPTQVHHVRHSERTISMLIDTLQALHEYKGRGENDSQAFTFSGDILREEADNSSGHACDSEHHDLKHLDSDLGNCPTPCQESNVINAGHGTHLPLKDLDSDLGNHLSPCRESNANHAGHEFGSHLPFVDSVRRPVSPISNSHSRKAAEHTPITPHSTFPAQVMKGEDACWPLASEERCTQSPKHHATFIQPLSVAEFAYPNLENLCEDSPPNRIGHSLRGSTSSDAHAMINCLSPAMRASSSCIQVPKSSQCPVQSCHYNKGIVSIDAMGYVRIASPPVLPFGDSYFKHLNIESHNMYESFLTTTKQLPMMDARRRLGVSEENKNAQTLDVSDDNQDIEPLLVNISASKTCCAGSTPGPIMGCYVASTPEEKILSRMAEELECMHGCCENNANDDSPRLCSLAEQGLVPSSPGLEKHPLQPDAPLFYEKTDSQYVDTIPNLVKCPGLKGNKSQLEHVSPDQPSVPAEENLKTQCPVLKGNKSQLEHVLPDQPSVLADGNRKTHDTECSIDDTNISRALSAIKVSNGHRAVPMKLFNEGQGGKFSSDKQTPVCPQSTSSWDQGLDATCSIQKPKRFRRLCKTKELSKHSLQQLHPFEPLAGRLGKKKVHSEAALLVDEEAEVSSDEDVSADEDDSENDGGSLQDFIDDKVEPTIGPMEESDEPIDMMAVYRKSLLSQSPLDGHSLPWMRRLLHNGTPISDDSNVSSSKCSESVLSVSSDSNSKVEPDSSMARISALQATPALDNRDHPNMLTPHMSESFGLISSQRNGRCQLPGSMQSTSKVHERKRKLSFQENFTASNVTNVSNHFDDDLFSGLDLDALEVEAVQRSRSHAQITKSFQQAITSAGALQVSSSNHTDLPVPSSNPSPGLLNTTIDDFDFFPSFNLGIDC